MNVEIGPLRAEHAARAVAIAERCYPHLAPAHRLRVEDVIAHEEVFGDGAFAASIDGTLVGFAVGWLLDFDFDHPEHRLEDVMEPEHHDPDGDWYYGLDISVDPDARSRGIGGMLYDARKAMIRRLGKKGMIAGGMIPGYRAVMGEVGPEEYIADVVAGRRRDPTLSFQLSQGFEVRGTLPNYVRGTAGDGIATLLVWEADR